MYCQVWAPPPPRNHLRAEILRNQSWNLKTCLNPDPSFPSMALNQMTLRVYFLILKIQINRVPSSWADVKRDRTNVCYLEKNLERLYLFAYLIALGYNSDSVHKSDL